MDNNINKQRVYETKQTDGNKQSRGLTNDFLYCDYSGIDNFDMRVTRLRFPKGQNCIFGKIIIFLQ